MIEKILDISIAHITDKDSLLLQIEQDFSVGEFDYGYFLFTKSNLETANRSLEKYSESFKKIHAYARKQNCLYILLDCDAEPEDTDELDIHNW